MTEDLDRAILKIKNMIMAFIITALLMFPIVTLITYYS